MLPSDCLLLAGHEGLRRSAVLARCAGAGILHGAGFVVPASTESAVGLFELLFKMFPCGNVLG